MDVRKLYDEGLKYIKEGKYKEALKCFNKVIEYYEKKKLRIKKGKYYKNILKNLDDDDINLFFGAWFYKGISLKNLGNLEEALKCFDIILKIFPDDIDALNGKGHTLYDLGKYEESIKCFDRVLEIDPNNTIALNGKGNILYDLERYEEAIKYYDRAIKYYENVIGISNSDYEDISKKLKCLHEEDIRHFSGIWNNKGNALKKVEKYNEALKCYDIA